MCSVNVVVNIFFLGALCLVNTDLQARGPVPPVEPVAPTPPLTHLPHYTMSGSISGSGLAQSVAERLADQIQVCPSPASMRPHPL